MTRRSSRLSTGSKVTSTPGHKRTASNTALAAKEAKRSKARVTPIKSPHFRNAGDQDDDDVEASASSAGDDASDFDEDDGATSASEVEDDEDDFSDEAPKARKKTTPKQSASASTTKVLNRTDYLKEGVKAGLGPGTQMIIKKPKARVPGKTPYSDDTIHPNTLLFLADLKRNNERPWLKMHDADFRQSERDWYGFVQQLTEKLIEIDDTVPELPVKDVIFRIYRDVRFSPDPTPYKPHFSAAWSRTGRKGPYAHYYVQISPHGQSFVGGGLWMPDAAPVAALRRDIDRRAQRIKGVLVDENIRKEFLGGIAKKETKAVAAFVSANSGNALKTKPKGYDADHKEIELLRLRNYTIGRKVTEEEVLGPNSLDRVTHLLQCMKPLITYLNSVVMPDEPEDESDEESQDTNDNSDEESE